MNSKEDLEARVRMLESMVYRLYTREELSTGQMNELIRLVLLKNPNYFERRTQMLDINKMMWMIDFDKVIDECNKNLEKRISEEMTKQKLKEEFNSKLNAETNYYQVEGQVNQDEGTLTTASYTTDDSIYSIYDSSIATIKERDQVRKVVINKCELLDALNINYSTLAPSIDDEIELTVRIVGRDCDSKGNPIE